MTANQSARLVFLICLSLILAALAGSIPGYLLGAKKSEQRVSAYWTSAFTDVGVVWETQRRQTEKAVDLGKNKALDVYYSGANDAAKVLTQDLGAACGVKCQQSSKNIKVLLQPNSTGFDMVWDEAALPEWRSILQKVKTSAELSAQGSVPEKSIDMAFKLETDERFTDKSFMIVVGMICATILGVAYILGRALTAGKTTPSR